MKLPKKLMPEFKKIDETLDNAELVCTKTDGNMTLIVFRLY